MYSGPLLSFGHRSGVGAAMHIPLPFRVNSQQMRRTPKFIYVRFAPKPTVSL